MRAWLAAIMVALMATATGCAAAGGRAKGPGLAGPTQVRGASPAGSSRGERSSGGSGAGSAFAEVARASLGPLSASKWRLPNGLTVVLLPDPSATSVSYTTWFRVGSRDENQSAGETGLAHLFEHLMFTQTVNHHEGEFDHTIEAAGGNANAMTYYDFTAYIDDLPPAELAVAVRLEADRMVNLDLLKRQVDNERDVVVEERLSSVEDNVDGTLDEMMYMQAYKEHPYRWPVIGLMKDIKAITHERAVAFYRRFYAPNHAVVVLTGRFEERRALDLIAEAYGGIPASTNGRHVDAHPERAPATVVRATLNRPVPADRFVSGFPAPGLAEADRAAYEVVNEVLTGGPSSRLYRQLVVDKAIASSVRGEVAPTRDPGLYAIWVQMTKGHAAEEAERILIANITDLATKPLEASELHKAQARLETDLLRQLGSSHGRADLLGQFEIASGDFRAAFTRASEYAAVGAADVQRIAASYLATGIRSVVIARPTAAPPRGKERS